MSCNRRTLFSKTQKHSDNTYAFIEEVDGEDVPHDQDTWIAKEFARLKPRRKWFHVEVHWWV